MNEFWGAGAQRCDELVMFTTMIIVNATTLHT